MPSPTLALAVPFTLALALPPAFAPAAPARDAELRWRDETWELDELPDDLPEGTRESLEYWAPWIEEVEYVVQLDEEARFALVAPDKKHSSREWDRVIQPTLELFDELAPLPDRSGDGETGASEASAPGRGLEWSWGEVVELEHDLAAFFRVADSDDFRSLLEHVAETREKDAGWVDAYDGLPGLVLHAPLAGVIVESAPGVEEWDPLNEMTNRIARLLLTRRFGKAPYWLTMGIAWHVEMEVRDNIYCFPHRKTFVGVAEHNGWKDALKKQFKKKNGPTVDMNQLCSWQPGTYDPVQAGRAWGTVRYLAESGPGALAAVLEDLRLLMREKGRVTHADGTWELIPGYQPDPTDTLEILQRRVDADFREDVTEYFRRGLRGAEH